MENLDVTNLTHDDENNNGNLGVNIVKWKILNIIITWQETFLPSNENISSSESCHKNIISYILLENNNTIVLFDF